MTKVPDQLGIRLPPPYAEQLAAAAEAAETTPTSFARQLLVEALDRARASDDPTQGGAIEAEVFLLRQEVEQLADGLQMIGRDTKLMRKDLYNAILKLLQAAGGMSPAEIREWAEEILSEE